MTLKTAIKAHRPRNDRQKIRICLKLLSIFFNDLNSIVQLLVIISYGHISALRSRLCAVS